jgi:hypothetical protein
MPRPRAGASRSPMLRSSRSISITVWYAPSLARQRRSVPPGRKSSNAEGEQQAAQKLVEAAHILAANPGAMQLRYLATLHAIASELSSTSQEMHRKLGRRCITPKEAVHYSSNGTTPILRNMNASERWTEFRCRVRPVA